MTLVSGVAALGGAGAGAAMWTPWSLTTRRYRVPIADLPRGLDGLRIVQLTDTHLGPRVPASFIEEAVGLARSLHPDVVVLTGDYVHNGRRHIERAAELFRPLVESRNGCMGVVAVLGNHDHYADAAAMAAALRARGIRVIDNRRLFVDGGRRLRDEDGGEDGLCLAGLGDLYEDAIDVESALGGVPAKLPRIVLAHNPDTAELSALASNGLPGPRIDLMISGHTHGGQVSLPLIGPPITMSRFGQKYAHGLVRGPACPVLVSAGVGMSLLPVRIGVPPEVVEITLERA
jgi:hypothetical protein